MSEVFTVIMPDIGEGVVEGEVIAWLKNVGDPLLQDEPVVVVMTDKATVELPSPYPGILSKQYFKPGEIAIKDKPLYDIELAESIMKEKETGKAPVVSNKIDEKAQPPQRKSIETPAAHKVLATPPVRHLAKEMGINIGKISGTGKEGRVTKEDLKAYTSTPRGSVTHLPDDEEMALIGIKGLMAKKMAESKRHIPHFSYHEKVDVVRLIKLRENMKKEGKKRASK